ncbi:MAG: HlyD family efflux transporter periplasmic adaptor subunit [Oscillospiraceae bacterium]|nr:HlyD family efflux transporter periplasmic adaptor subunit [Oscillospiraceae bacterium]
MATEVQTPAAEPVSATPPTPKRTNEQKKKIKALIKRIITIVLVLAILAGGGYATWYFVFREDKGAGLGEPLFDTASIGSIIQTANISGTSNAKDSASITLTQSGVVESLFVYEGQMVYEGDPLYVITSEAAQEALVAAQEAYQGQADNMAKLREEMADLRRSRGDLTITAPHAGKLTDVIDLKVGDPLNMGTPIARIVDDTKLKLSLYYSYAYESDIYVGKTVTVSVPVVMSSLTGTVEKINKVRMIAPEGGVNFEVIIVVDNPGTMTEGMAATASMTDDNGSPIYPYADGSFTYYQTTTVSTKAAGPVDRLADLMNYADVTAGQILVVQGTNNVDELIRAKQEQVDAAQEALNAAAQRVEEAEQNLVNFSAVAPITGTITALPIYEGMEVNAGTTAIMIANNSVMTVNFQVDDRNRQYINVGDEIELSDWNGNSYIGVVDSIAVIGENQGSGVTVFPGVIRVDNPFGTLMGGYWLRGTITTASSIDCITIPLADIRSYSPEGSEEIRNVVYIKTDETREGAIDPAELPEAMRAAIPEGCIVMPVEVGLNDTYNAEIISGVELDDEVYNSTPKADGNYSSWG